MDVINKLYSSVTSTVSSQLSQLSTVLPGNPLSREFEVENFITSAGIGQFWKIFNGYKKSTRQKVSIFVLEKKVLENFSKSDRECMLNILKSGIYQLTKIRHPNILTVQHPLEESRDSLAFATEPIFSCLHDLLTQTNKKSDASLFDVEIKHGLLQIAHGLNFIHSDMKIVHRNLTSKSIIINDQGSWKIFGFDFCISGCCDDDKNYSWPFQEYRNNVHTLTQPPLEFTAPEFAINSSIVPESDLYSFGMLIYCIYANGSTLKEFNGNLKNFNQFANDLNRGNYPNLLLVPQDLRETVKNFMHPSPKHRLNLQDFKNIQFFDDNRVQTLLYLDSLYHWDNLQKSKFYKSLSSIIPTFPKRVNLSTIIPSLANEYVNPQMIPFVLPNVFLIAEGCDKNDFEKYILKSLVPVFKLEEPIQIVFIIMQHMDLIIKLTPVENIKSDILPMLFRILESNNAKLQIMCLEVIPNISSLIQNMLMKNSLLPRIQTLCLKPSSLSVKVNCLICIGKLLEHLDKWVVMDKIIPFLTQIESRDPAIIMAIIGIIKLILTTSKLGISKQIISTKVIPFIMPFCIENGLTINQFKQIMDLIKTLVNKVETEQITALNQSIAMTNSTSLSSFAESLPSKPSTANKLDQSDLDNNFSIFEDNATSYISAIPPFEPKQNSLVKKNITSPVASSNIQSFEQKNLELFDQKKNFMDQRNLSAFEQKTIKSFEQSKFAMNTNFKDDFNNNDKSNQWMSTGKKDLNYSSGTNTIQYKLENNILEPQNKSSIEPNTSNTNILSQQEILDFLN